MLLTRKVSHHGKETLDCYVELFAKKRERILQPRNQSAFALCKAPSFYVTAGLLPKHKTTNIKLAEHFTVQSL